MKSTESPRPTKVCPVVIRGGGADRQILVFRHPLAGVQLVKGTIELDEKPGPAALRELREESGIETAQVSGSLGIWDSGHDGQIWEFVGVRVPRLLPDRWTHRAPDDGGHEFEFFWHDLAQSPSAEWHPLFVAALEFIRDSGVTPFSRVAGVAIVR
jgi:8-oxo-dGTP pyrophosphatase MutT (NUDIX family)